MILRQGDKRGFDSGDDGGLRGGAMAVVKRLEAANVDPKLSALLRVDKVADVDGYGRYDTARAGPALAELGVDVTGGWGRDVEPDCHSDRPVHGFDRGE